MAGDLRTMVEYLESHETDAKDGLTGGLDQVFKW